MKKLSILRKFYIFSFIFILILIPFFWTLITAINPEFQDMINFDLEEKRNKSELTDINIDNFQTKIENYYNDRLPFRSILIVKYRDITNYIESLYNKNIGPYLLKKKNEIEQKNAPTKEELDRIRIEEALAKLKEEGLNENYHLMDEAVEKYYKNRFGGIDEYDVDNSYYPLKIINERVIQGKDDWFFLNDTLPNYTGANNIKEDKIENYIKPFIKLKQKCDELGKELIFITIPDKNKVYYEYMPTVEIVDPIERTQKIYDYIKNNTDLNYTYMKQELLDYKNKFRLYYKYDSHYNKLGAYIVARKVLNNLGIENEDINNNNITYTDMNIGDLLLIGNINGLAYPPDKDFTVKYKEDVIINKSETGLKNEDGTDLVSVYSSNANIDKKLFYVGDSYRYNIMEYLAKNFDESMFADRTQTTTALCKKMIKESDVIIIESVGRFEETIAKVMAEQVLYVLNS